MIPLTGEEIRDLEKILNLKYISYIRQRDLRIAVDADEDYAFATVTLASDDKAFYYPVEGKIAHLRQNLSPKEAVLLLLDFIDLYFERYFKEDEETMIPIDWCQFDFEGVELLVRGQIKNLKAENEADLLLQTNALPMPG
jgi:hypothetical protein